MSAGHRAPPRPTGRIRAVLALGMVLGLGTVGTAASWTDAASITGTSFTSGTLDLQVNDLNAVTSATLTMANMVPAATSAQVFQVKNAATAPFTYTISGELGGAEAGMFTNSLLLSISANATRTGTGNTSVCTGGTALVSNVALTPTTSTVTTAQGPLAVGAPGVPLCFQMTFLSTAPSSLQGKTSTATFTVTATSTP